MSVVKSKIFEILHRVVEEIARVSMGLSQKRLMGYV